MNKSYDYDILIKGTDIEFQDGIVELEVYDVTFDSPEIQNNWCEIHDWDKKYKDIQKTVAYVFYHGIF